MTQQQEVELLKVIRIMQDTVLAMHETIQKLLVDVEELKNPKNSSTDKFI